MVMVRSMTADRNDDRRRWFGGTAIDVGSLGVKGSLVLFTCVAVVVVVVVVVGIGTPTGDDDGDFCATSTTTTVVTTTRAPVRR